MSTKPGQLHRELRAHALQAVGPDRREIDRLLHRELVERRQAGQIRPIGVPVEVHHRILSPTAFS
jgi:hypothetical protein